MGWETVHSCPCCLNQRDPTLTWSLNLNLLCSSYSPPRITNLFDSLRVSLSLIHLLEPGPFSNPQCEDAKLFFFVSFFPPLFFLLIHTSSATKLNPSLPLLPFLSHTFLPPLHSKNTMGLLSLGTPMHWDEAKKYADHVRTHGIIQFLNLWEATKDSQKDCLLWGDEIEYMVVSYDDENEKAKLSLRVWEILLELAKEEEEAAKDPAKK